MLHINQEVKIVDASSKWFGKNGTVYERYPDGDDYYYNVALHLATAQYVILREHQLLQILSWNQRNGRGMV